MAVPARESLPRYVAPLPERLETFALRYAWVIVAINLAGTAFGFWFYGLHPFSTPMVVDQFSIEPLAMWPFVPDSPVATLFIALSLAAWKLGHRQGWLDALAFLGCIQLGAWTPFTLLVFRSEFSYLHPAMYNFLFWSHLAMVVQAFVVHRYSEFRLGAAAVAVGWYLLNDVVDYFVPVVGTPHHTLVPAEPIVNGAVRHVSPAHEYAAAGAVVLTVVGTVLLVATRAEKLKAQLRSREAGRGRDAP